MNDLRQKTPAELTTLAAELRAKIRDARFTIASRQNAKVHVLRGLRKDLARVLMALTLTKTPTV